MTNHDDTGCFRVSVHLCKVAEGEHSPAPPPPAAEAARRLGCDAELSLLLPSLLLLLLGLGKRFEVRAAAARRLGGDAELSLLLLEPATRLLMVCIPAVLGLRREARRGAGSAASAPVQGMTKTDRFRVSVHCKRRRESTHRHRHHQQLQARACRLLQSECTLRSAGGRALTGTATTSS